MKIVYNYIEEYIFIVIVVSSIDAATETRIGNFVNYSPKRFKNCSMKMVDVDGTPDLCLLSIKEIPKGAE